MTTWKTGHLIQLLTMAPVLLVLMTGCATRLDPNPSHLQAQAGLSASAFDYSPYARLLADYVNPDGLVDYVKVTEHRDMLERFYAAIASYSPDSHPELFPGQEEKLAYWLNAYNATVIKAVISHYPITSVQDVRGLFFLPPGNGFFFLQKMTYGGTRTSFYFLENSIIRKRFNDPRIHFALNCASLGCPRLPQKPFLPQTLSADLDQATREFINDATKVRFEADSKTLYLSPIFQWYTEDFTHGIIPGRAESKRTLTEYVLLYLEPGRKTELAACKDSLTIRFLDYDWGLNDQAK